MQINKRGGGVSANALISIVAPKLLKNSHGMGSMMTVLGAAVAAAVIVFPLARWQMSLSNNTATVSESLDNAGVKLEMMSALEDRWRQINDMNLDEFKVATDKTTTYGRYTVSESFGTLGKYNSSTGKCDAETPGDDDKACRTATLTVIGPDGVLPLGPVTATRVASAGKSGDAFPVGTIFAYTGKLSDLNKLKDWHICDGTNGTPDLQERFLEGVKSINDIKQLHSAGLPNITGSWRAVTSNAGTIGWGAFRWDGWYQYISDYSAPSNGNRGSVYSFDASRVDSIYGNSTTVQPKSYTVVYIMKTK